MSLQRIKKVFKRQKLLRPFFNVAKTIAHPGQFLKKTSLWLRRSHGRNSVRDRFKDLKRLLNTESPRIYDIGANEGWFIKLFLEQYHNPHIKAFEPIPDVAKRLQQEFAGQNNIEILGYAIGSTSEIKTLNITNNLVSSSLLKPTRSNIEYHGNSVEIYSQVPTQVETLAKFLQPNETVDLIKIDAQGYELEILKGAGEGLKNVKALTIEVEFVPMYENQPLFSDIDLYLRSQGFFIFNLYEIWTHKDGQIEAADATYLNSRYFQIGQLK